MRLDEGLLRLLRAFDLQRILQELGDDIAGRPLLLGADWGLHLLQQDQVLALYLAELGFQAGVLQRNWRLPPPGRAHGKSKPSAPQPPRRDKPQSAGKGARDTKSGTRGECMPQAACRGPLPSTGSGTGQLLPIRCQHRRPFWKGHRWPSGRSGGVCVAGGQPPRATPTPSEDHDPALAPECHGARQMKQNRPGDHTARGLGGGSGGHLGGAVSRNFAGRSLRCL